MSMTSVDLHCTAYILHVQQDDGMRGLPIYLSRPALIAMGAPCCNIRQHALHGQSFKAGQRHQTAVHRRRLRSEASLSRGPELRFHHTLFDTADASIICVAGSAELPVPPQLSASNQLTTLCLDGCCKPSFWLHSCLHCHYVPHALSQRLPQQLQLRKATS